MSVSNEQTTLVQEQILRELGAKEFKARSNDYSRYSEVWVNLVATPSEVNPYSLAMLLVKALKINGSVTSDDGYIAYTPTKLVVNHLVPSIPYPITDENENGLVEDIYKVMQKKRKNLVGVCYEVHWREERWSDGRA